MADGSAANFLRILDRQNAAIAAREAEKETQELAETDPIRLQREKERREKWGELRAREHRGKRPNQISNVFGHIDLAD